MNQYFTFSVFKNGVAKEKGWDLECSKLVEKIKYSEILEKTTKEARESYHQLKKAKAKKEEFENRDNNDPEKQEAVKKFDEHNRAYTNAKKQLPLITTHVFFEKGRRDMDPHTFNNLILVDVDHISNEEVQRLMADVRERPYILFANRSVSGEGYHFLVAVNVDEGMNDENFKDVFEATTQYVEWDLKISADRKVGTISRCMFLNHDAEIYYNPNVQALDMNVGLYLQQHDFINIIHKNDMIEVKRLEKYLDVTDPNLNWNAGNRHATLVALTAQLNKNGFSKEGVMSVCCQRYAEPDFDKTEIAETIDDIYNRYASEHGTNIKGFTFKKDKGTKGHIATNIPEELEEDDWDEDKKLCTPCPDVKEINAFVPDYFYRYIIDPTDSPQIQFASIFSLLVASGAMMCDVSCHVKKGETVGPYLFMTVTGGAASGKSCINRATNLFFVYSNKVEKESKIEEQKRVTEQNQWKKCVNNCKEEDCGCGEKPEDVDVKRIAMSTNISQNKLICQLNKNKDIASLLYAPEMDYTLNMKDMPLSTNLRAIFENERIGAHSYAHGDFTVDKPKASLLTAGTPQQLTRFFGNKEDGLVSRFITLFLEESPYIPLQKYSDIDDYRDLSAVENRILVFAQYASQRHLVFRLTDLDRKLLDDYFCVADSRFANFSSSAVTSFIRRLRGINIRTALVLAVYSLYTQDKPDGTYDIPEEIIHLVISWNDYLIEQHIKLLSLLPEIQERNGGREMENARIFAKLPCNFSYSEALTHFGDTSFAVKKRVQRTLKKWTIKGLLEHSHNHYQKVECMGSTQTYGK